MAANPELYESVDLRTDWLAMATELEIPPHAHAVMEQALEALRDHDFSVYEHSMRVALSAVKIARTMGVDDEKPLFYAGTTHDIGKCNVPASQLNKKPWTPEDAEALKEHPLVGYEWMRTQGFHVTAGIVILHHTFQTNAYPERIPQDDVVPPVLAERIPVYGRILALADFYDACHRNDGVVEPTSESIRTKMYDCNPDMHDVITQLYAQGDFQ